MNAITEFLSSINIWLAVVLVDFSLFAIGYMIAVCVKLIQMEFNPVEYAEKNDFYEGSDPYYELYEYYDSKEE